jgi:hypothetical protein
MVTPENQRYISRLDDAVRSAHEAVDQLPLSTPAPVRDQFFGMIVNGLMELPHRSEHCPDCMSYAHSMAISALGWQDANAPRPATAQERMDALQEQMRIALDFLNSLNDKRETDRGCQ